MRLIFGLGIFWGFSWKPWGFFWVLIFAPPPPPPPFDHPQHLKSRGGWVSRGIGEDKFELERNRILPPTVELGRKPDCKPFSSTNICTCFSMFTCSLALVVCIFICAAYGVNANYTLLRNICRSQPNLVT